MFRKFCMSKRKNPDPPMMSIPVSSHKMFRLVGKTRRDPNDSESHRHLHTFVILDHCR